MGQFWRFVAEIPKDQRDYIAAIPGLKLNDEGIAAPRNAAWLVSEILNASGLPFVLKPPRESKPRSARNALPFLQEYVPAFLTSYQRDGIKAVLSIPGESGTFIWSAGSGKTLGALVWITADGPGISVVVTKAGIRPTWAREIGTYTRGVDWKILEGTAPEQIGEIRRDRPTIVVIGYDTLPDWISFLKTLKIRSVVFDEIHKVKSHKRWSAEVQLGGEDSDSQIIVPGAPIEPVKVSFTLNDNQTAACYQLSRMAQRRLATTATPIKDRVRDLWAQLDLIHPWEWGAYWDWARRYCAAAEGVFGGMQDKGESNLEELKKRLRLVGHRVPYSVANRDLPPKRRLVTYLKVYEQCRPEGGIAAELRAAGRSGGAALLEARLMEAASRKRKVVLAHARDALEAGLKVVIFTGRRVDCERLAKEAWEWIGDSIVSRVIKGLQVWAGHGGDDANLREKWRAEYMAAKGPALLVGTGDAWGEGLDLQDTDLAIFAMLPYTPGQIIQWEGRFCRLGQKRPVLIRYLICEGSIDEHVATILMNKLPAVEKATNSDEISGLGRELIGASEEELLASLCSKVLGETGS